MELGILHMRPPHGLTRLAARLPIWLYQAGLGWLLGDRFLMLTHIGRKSGLSRQVVLEVVAHDKGDDTYVVASGWGERSDWFRNIQHNPEVVVTTGRRRFAARSCWLSTDEATQTLCDYVRRHPVVGRNVGKLILGEPLDGREESCRRVAEVIPLVALRRES